MREEGVEYHDGDVELRGFLVSEDRDRTRPGMLVVHGGAGLDDHAKGRARQLAQLGLVAFACDMYGTAVNGDGDRVMSTITDLIGNRDKLCQRALAAIHVLESNPQVNASIVAVGYCFGGRTVLELARSGADLAGVISVHGSLETAKRARPGDVKAKLLVCHGSLDPYVPSKQVTDFIEEMNLAGTDYQLIVYGGALHGFTHDIGPRTPRAAYHALSDERSFRAIKTFVTEVLGTDAAGTGIA